MRAPPAAWSGWGAVSGFFLTGQWVGLLLCFKADRAELEGRSLGAVTVALSPTPVSDGGGYAALWGGEEGKEAESYAA